MPLQVLVVSKTAGYRHTSIPSSISALEELSSKTGLFTVTSTEDVDSYITDEALSIYNVVIFLQTTGDFLSDKQIQALRTYMHAGSGFVGIHAASAGMKSDEWYGRLIGAHFDGHPEPEPGTVIPEQQAAEDDGGGSFIINGCCQDREGWMDEWYNFTSHPRQNPSLRFLLKGDVQSFKGSKMGDDHPLAWYQEFEGGRSFYTALGHFDEAYSDEWFMGMILRAILWVGKAENSHIEGL